MPVLRQKLLYDVSFDVRKAEVPSLELIGEFGMVDTQPVHNSGLQIVNVGAVWPSDAAQAESKKQ